MSSPALSGQETMAASSRDEVGVGFTADGLELSGVLRCPPGRGPHPAIVLTGPFTGVKDQVVGLYARRLAASGFVTLAFDHRGFGGSGGRRGHEDTQGKLSDLRAAVTFLAGRTEVDGTRVATVGVCLGGGYAVRAAATDPRIRIVVGVAGAYNSPTWFAGRMGAERYRAALASFVDRYDEWMPVVSDGDEEAAMGGAEPLAYYGTERSRSALWENRVTRGSLHALMTFDALGAAGDSVTPPGAAPRSRLRESPREHGPRCQHVHPSRGRCRRTPGRQRPTVPGTPARRRDERPARLPRRRPPGRRALG